MGWVVEVFVADVQPWAGPIRTSRMGMGQWRVLLRPPGAGGSCCRRTLPSNCKHRGRGWHGKMAPKRRASSSALPGWLHPTWVTSCAVPQWGSSRPVPGGGMWRLSCASGCVGSDLAGCAYSFTASTNQTTKPHKTKNLKQMSWRCHT